MSFLESIRDTLGITAPSPLPMELRLFRLLCLAGTALTFLAIVPVQVAIRLPLFISAVDLAFGAACLFLYLRSCRGHFLIRSLYLLYLLDLTLTWFPNNGSHGCIHLFYVNAFIYALTFFRGRERWLLLAGAVADWALLMLAEGFFPVWLVPYQSPAARLVDLALSLSMSVIYCSFMLWALLSSYDREQRRLTTLNAELERSMAERIEAEHSLRQSRELLHSVVEGTSDAVFAKDTGGRYILFNGAAALLTGKNEAEVLGHDDHFLFPPVEAEVIMAQDQDIILRGEICHLEQELTGCRGRKLVLQATKGPLRDENGRIIGVFGISRDVTEYRRVEDEIRQLNSELDQRVIERTARLEAAIKEQESFSYSVSHDLRAPLRHINSYSAILAEECADRLTPEALGYLERIGVATRNMGQLIDELLELSRIGRSQLQRTSVNLSEMATEIFQELLGAEPQRRVELVVAPNLTVRGDRYLLQQALVNLLENAWKYTSNRESARIELGRDRSGAHEVFFVKDNGVGFDMAYRDKLFGVFQRLHGAEFEGTGIGLATVKRIVKRHGGAVWAEGEVDAGATIFFTLSGGPKAGEGGEAADAAEESGEQVAC